jgi:hypothetical protein
MGKKTKDEVIKNGDDWFAYFERIVITTIKSNRNKISCTSKISSGLGMDLMVECSPNRPETLGWISSKEKKKCSYDQ